MAKVKRKINGEWTQVGQTPLYTPISLDIYDGIKIPEPIEPGDETVLYNSGSYSVEGGGEWQASGIALTIKKGGTYRFITHATGMGVLVDGAVAFAKNGNRGSSHNIDFALCKISEDISCEAGDEIEVWATSVLTGRVIGLAAQIYWSELRGFLNGD